ncbi:D-aspartate oxidase-like [Tubulanus polymorphus]|uniref:D-aspartate oxidase-like n=1 Tax=Tubulanus polymorphus TaxID=672921 RepID=UPI003DA4239A
MSHQRQKIAVIGAGVIGLTTAVCLQDTYPSADITIIADRFGTDTVSTIAAGLLRITKTHTPGTPADVLGRWSRDSFEFFDNLAYSAESPHCGIAPQSVTHVFYEKPEEEPFYKNFVLGYRELSEKELKHFPGFKFGVNILTTIMEGNKFLPWLTNKFKSRGGRIEVCKLSSLEPLVDKYDVAVTCCALGARELLNDKSVYPVRGQVIRVEAPWLKFSFFAQNGVYIIVGKNYTTVGGVRQVNDWNLEEDPKDTEMIWKKAVEFMPSLRDAKRLGVYVGLRPARRPVRVEKEVMNFGSKTLKVVHNYGHGANGVGLSWGTAKHATELVGEFLQKSKL